MTSFFDGTIKKIRDTAVLQEGIMNATSENYDLVTLYIPRARNIKDVIQQLRHEEWLIDGKNPSGKKVRENVKEAIRNILEDILVQFSKDGVPASGVVYFARGDTKETISYIPKGKINISLFSINNKFATEPFEKILFGKTKKEMDDLSKEDRDREIGTTIMKGY